MSKNSKKPVTPPLKPKVTEHTANLKYPFKETEIQGMSQELAESVKAKKIKEDEAKSISSQYKSEIDGFQAKLSSLSEKITSGWEMRMIKCRETIDWEKDIRTVVRLDTGEVIDQGPIPEDQRQMMLNDQR